MTPDGFLSLLALIIAALAFLPLVRRLHLRATLRRSVIISVLAFTAVIYFEFYAVLKRPCLPILSDGHCMMLMMGDKSSFGPRDAAFAITVLWLVFMGLIYQLRSIPPTSLPALKAIVAQRLQARDYETLVDLVEPHLPLIHRAARRELRAQRFYDWWERLREGERIPIRDILPFPAEPSAPRPWWRRALGWCRRMSGWLGWPLRDCRSLEQAGEWILERLLAEPGLRRHLVQHRPEFGARLMVLSGYRADDFTRKFFTALAGDPESSLYIEIEQSGGADHSRSRQYDEHSPLLGALLNDASVADKISAWTPIAEHFLARLHPDNDPAYVASLRCMPDRYWDEVGRHRDSGFVTVSFFDLMVTNAAYQGVPSHMWLMYTDHFVKALLKVHDESGIDEERLPEYPTRSAALLGQIVTALVDWTELVLRLPDDSVHRELNSNRLEEGGSSIPKWALLSLANVVQMILLDPKVGEQVKTTVFQSAVYCVGRLPAAGAIGIYRDHLVRALTGEGMYRDRDIYVELAWDIYADLDHVLQMKTGDLEAALQAALPGTAP